jgi:hypothetical protein
LTAHPDVAAVVTIWQVTAEAVAAVMGAAAAVGVKVAGVGAAGEAVVVVVVVAWAAAAKGASVVAAWAGKSCRHPPSS